MIFMCLRFTSVKRKGRRQRLKLKLIKHFQHLYQVEPHLFGGLSILIWFNKPAKSVSTWETNFTTDQRKHYHREK